MILQIIFIVWIDLFSMKHVNKWCLKSRQISVRLWRFTNLFPKFWLSTTETVPAAIMWEIQVYSLIYNSPHTKNILGYNNGTWMFIMQTWHNWLMFGYHNVRCNKFLKLHCAKITKFQHKMYVSFIIPQFYHVRLWSWPRNTYTCIRLYRLSMGCHTVSPAPVWVRIPGP